jgi:hypothetical protein
MAVNECQICPSWIIPRGQNYLIASGVCLEFLSRQQGAANKAADNLYLYALDSLLFNDCDHAADAECKKEVQQLKEVEACFEPTGAVIFGQKCNKFRKERKGKGAAEGCTIRGNSEERPQWTRSLLTKPQPASVP